MNEPIIRIEHVRAAGMCVRGARQWFTSHGIDFQSFLRQGVPASLIESKNDALGSKVVAFVRSQGEGK